MRILRTLEQKARLPLLAGGALLLATMGARADEAGDMLLRRVAGKVNATQPAVCDYTVTYTGEKMLMVETHHAFSSGTTSGQSSMARTAQGSPPPGLGNLLFRTLSFMPDFKDLFGAGTNPALNVDARYVGKESWKGRMYEVVDVTLPIQPLNGDSPTRRLVLRWYVSADNVIHRITTRLPLVEADGTRPVHDALDTAKVRGGLVVADKSSPSRQPLPVKPLPFGRSSANGSDKPPAAPDGMITVEAVSEGARKAVMPAVRPPTNPPLPARLRLEAGNGRGPVLLSPDGRLLAIVNDDSSISLYDPSTGMKTLDLTGHNAPAPHVPLTHLQFAAGSRLLVSADSVDTIRVWDTTTGLLKQEIKTPGDILSGICVSPDGGLLGAFNSVLGMLYLWNRNTGAALPPLPIGSAQTVAFSPDATRLVTVGSVEMALWDVTSGKARLRVPYVGGPFGVLPAAWSPDGKQYVWMRSDGGLVVCDGQSGAQTRELKGAAGALAALAFAADGKTLLGVDVDQRGGIPTGKPGLVIWNTTDWTVQEARELAGARTAGFQNPPILAPAGRRLLLIDNEGLQFWDLAETLPPLNTKP